MTPRFAGGEKVYVKNLPTVEHTRLPGHLRDHVGIVDTVYPATYSLPHLDRAGRRRRGDAGLLSCVRSGGRSGRATRKRSETIYADLFEAYLEKVELKALRDQLHTEPSTRRSTKRTTVMTGETTDRSAKGLESTQEHALPLTAATC